MTFKYFPSEKNRSIAFRLIAGNGRIILSSVAFPSMVECWEAILDLRLSSNNPNCFQLQNSKSKKYSYAFYDAAGSLLACSPHYRSATSRNRALRQLPERLHRALLTTPPFPQGEK